MSTYDYHLPEAFPVMYIVRKSMADKWALFLINGDPPATNGSSFAVTADTYEQNNRKFWLSKVSMDRLVEAGLIT